MTHMSHIRRIAILTCAVMAVWTSAASASPAYDPIIRSAPAESSSSESSGGGTGLLLPIAFGATLMVLAVAGASYTFRSRPRQRTIA